MRQDAFVLQMIVLFDIIWKQSGLDLHLKPYACISTGTDHGLMEFVPSSTLASILTERADGTALNAFIKSDQDPVAMQRFVASCAGYCVITYILGIGDRHLDNLLLSCNGKRCHLPSLPII
jgi:phosphatidylinositol 3-kinase